MDISQYPALNKGIIHFDVASAFPLHTRVIDSIDNALRNHCGAYSKAQYQGAIRSNNIVEKARSNIASFISCDPAEVFLVPSATDALRIVADMWLSPSQSMLYSPEDHSSLVKSVKNKSQKVDSITYKLDGTYNLHKNLPKRADIVFSSYIHHLYGVDNPINTLKSLYPSSKLVVDASQAISRMPVNVKKLQCDALMFSAEKAGGLSGVGVLFIAKKHHKKIKQTIEPHSMPVVAVAALDSAISVLKSADIYSINRTLSTQTSKIIESLNSIDGLSFTKGIGYPDNKCHGNGIVSFTIDGYDSKDIASFLDDNNIQVRAGDHCIDEKHQTRNVVRISSHIFNDDEQIDLLLQTLHHL